METGDEEVSINLLFCDDVPVVELCPLELLLCHVGVTGGDSGLCCSCDGFRALINSLV